MTKVTYFTIGRLEPIWMKVLEESFDWPGYPGVPCKEVYKNAGGCRITRRFNIIGELIYSNEQKFGYKLPQRMY